MTDERTKLTTSAPELYPSRVETGAVMLLEKGIFGVLMLLSVATVIVCIVFGAKNHGEHILFGAVLALVAVCFLLVARMYRDDVVQDRKFVYLFALALLLLCVTGLVYSARWDKCNPPPPPMAPSNCSGSQDYYNPARKACAHLPVTNDICLNETIAADKSILMLGLFPPSVNCTTAKTIITNCGTQLFNFECV